MNIKIATSILIVFLIGGQFIFSQTTIRGKIINGLGKPIGDVTVSAKGTNHSAQTRPDGSFSIEVDSSIEYLVFSKPELLSITKRINGKFLDITMWSQNDELNIVGLSEIVLYEEDDDLPKIYEVYNVNEKPIFPGGESELNRFIETHIQYPEEAKKNNISGTVYVRFVITETGQIGEAQIMNSSDPLLDEEAVRVVRSLPAWIPGKKNGNPVSVWFIVPCNFKSPSQ